MNHQNMTREPDAESGNYEAQAASSAPAAPTQERQRQTDVNDENGDRVMQPIDERASTTGLIQDQKWQYFAGRWDAIQAGFVDDPRRTVEQADRLVAEVIDHLAKIFRDERSKLEGQWSRGGKADTEDLRIAMQRYRDFFRTLVGR